MSHPSLSIEHTRDVCLITLTRPKLDVEALRSLSAALRQAEADEAVRAVVLTGREDFFCLGGDLGAAPDGSTLEVLAFGEAFIAVHRTITSLRLPVLAAVNGRAHGGGFSLVEACDLAVAAESARFAIPEIRSGAAPMMALAGAYRTLTRKQAMALALLGDELDARQALDWGLVNRVVPDGRLLPAVLDMARQLAGFCATSLGVIKAAYLAMDGGRHERELREGLHHLVVLLGA